MKLGDFRKASFFPRDPKSFPNVVPAAGIHVLADDLCWRALFITTRINVLAATIPPRREIARRRPNSRIQCREPYGERPRDS
jgi:hypothetical protein